MNLFPHALALFILPPGKIQLIAEIGRDARPGGRVLQNLEGALWWNFLRACDTGANASQRHEREQLQKLPVCSHFPLIVSDPIAYQPSACLPSFAKRIAGFPVRGSSMATRTSYSPSVRFSGM